MARRARRAVAFTVVFALAAAVTVAVIVLPGLLDRYGDRFLSRQQCTVELDGDTHQLTAEQANNAALIAAVAAERGLAARASTIGIATAIQESSLRNIDYGDRDSVGLFQQRPSQGWGSVEEIMDPYYSAGKFYEELVKVDGWRDMVVTEAAQRVQRSAFPEAYGDHEPEARLWASALRGHSGPAAVTCDLGDADATTVEAFADRVDRDFGAERYEVEVLDVADGVTELAVTPREVTETENNAMAAWATSVASVEGVESVAVDGRGWSRADGEFTDDEETPHSGVTVAIRTED